MKPLAKDHTELEITERLDEAKTVVGSCFKENDEQGEHRQARGSKKIVLGCGHVTHVHTLPRLEHRQHHQHSQESHAHGHHIDGVLSGLPEPPVIGQFEQGLERFFFELLPVVRTARFCEHGEQQDRQLGGIGGQKLKHEDDKRGHSDDGFANREERVVDDPVFHCLKGIVEDIMEHTLRVLILLDVMKDVRESVLEFFLTYESIEHGMESDPVFFVELFDEGEFFREGFIEGVDVFEYLISLK